MNKNEKLLRFLPAALLMLIGALFIVYGATDGEAAAVLKKAINICMECIGLG